MIEMPEINLVRMQRIGDLEPIICRIFHSTNECIVAAELSESLDLDGLCIVPTRTILCFDRAFEKADFYRAALSAWPDVNPHAKLLAELSFSLNQDLRFFAKRRDVIAVHVELDEPDICYVGTVKDVTDTELLLSRISSSGQQISEPLSVELGSITKIELATRYLFAVGYAARKLT